MDPTQTIDPYLRSDAAAELRQQVALFRYGVIADLAHLSMRHRGLYKLLEEKAAREYEIPGSLRRRVAAETIRGWLRDYRRGGFEALVPKVRADAGSARSIPAEVVDVLCHVKDEHPDLSVPLVIAFVRKEHGDLVPAELPLPESTVHRLLARRGLTKKRKADDGTSKDRRRFEFAEAGDLWTSDVMYGPKLRIDGKLRQTYLIAFLDDATRIVPYASFTLSEGTTAYLGVLEQAIRRRGIPKRLYVDNGAAFRSKHLGLVCAKLGIALIHARPYTPQGKGKIERWFRTVRMQFLPVMALEKSTSLEQLNRALAAWIEGDYHHAEHKGLDGETPASRWACRSEGVRLPDSDVGQVFLAEQNRNVQKDRTVTLDGVAYEVDAALVGERVLLRYDASRAPHKRTVEVWHRGVRIEIARRVDTLANCFVKRNGTTKNIEFAATSSDADVEAEEAPRGNAMRSLRTTDPEES
ncbi:MAG: DDE-type integrase/transposase/recombinase [Polyangiales bacterium]